MSAGEPFIHQTYHSGRPTASYRLMRPDPVDVPPSGDLWSSEFAAPIVSAARRFAAADVAAIYLVHGTFDGTDALGLLTELERYLPGVSQALGRTSKRIIDWFLDETGNYAAGFQDRLQQCVAAGSGGSISVTRWNWSSQNNHIGRADAAVRLLVELARCAETEAVMSRSSPRLMLWGHSHGGNVLALVASLLAADAAARSDFFAAARRFTQPWFAQQSDRPAWQEAASILDDAQHPLRRCALDMVTFGTPIRYAFAAGGYAKLMHFVNHHCGEGRSDWLGPRRIGPFSFLTAAEGDCIAQIGIAGSNIMPLPLLLRPLLADWSLHRLLQRGARSELWFRRIGYGQRVFDAGTTVLVDYQDPAKGYRRHLAGHALYTRSRWLPFHCQQIAEEFYGGS